MPFDLYWKINMRISPLAFLMFFFTHVALADESEPPELTQRTLIEGRLLERGTRRPLPEVNVFILPHELRAQTDEKGNFSFPEVPPGEFNFIVNHSGYLRLTLETSTDQSRYQLYLEKEFYDVFETTVTGRSEKKDVVQRTLKQEDFLKAPGAQEDPVKAIQNLPGIANQNLNTAQVVIQGSDPEDTAYALNGHEIPIVFHFGGLSSIIMPQAIEAVDFLASGFGPEFGRATGGIINLRTRSPKTDRTHGMAFVDLYNSGALIEGPITEKQSYFLSARQSYIGAVLNAVGSDSPAFDLTLAPTFSDVFGIYEYQISEHTRFSLNGVRSRDQIEFVLSEPVGGNAAFRGQFFQQTDFWRVIPRLETRLNSMQNLDISLGYGDNNILFEVGDNFFSLESSTLTHRSELETRLTPSYTNYIGLDIERIRFDVGLQFPDSSGGGVPNVGQVEGADLVSAAYIRNQWEITEKWSLYPNFRVSHFSQTEQFYWMPRISAAYRPIESLSLSLAYGLYYQPPINGRATEEFGNPNLRSEQAQHVTLAANKDFRQGRSNGLVLDSALFYKHLKDLILSSTDRLSDGTPKRFSNDGSGDIYGLQLQGRWNQDQWTFMGAYTHMDSTRLTPNEGRFPAEFDQTHNLNFITSYDTPRWTYSARVRYVTGNPYTPVSGAVYSADNDFYTPEDGSFFSRRYDSFMQLDIRVDRKWVFNRWILSAYLDIQNATNAKNPLAINYNFDYTEKATTNALPILPIFGLKGEF
jgi:hypothetical protein